MEAPATSSPPRAWFVVRWLLLPAAIWAGWILGIYFRLFAMPHGTGQVWGDLQGTFVMESLVVLAAAVMAPRHNLAVAALIASLGILLNRRIVGFEDSLLGLVLGGSFSVAVVAAITSGRGRWRFALGALLVGAGACGACVKIAEERKLEEEATPDEPPYFLQDLLRERTGEIRAVHAYDSSFMMYTDLACRVDASPELLEFLIDKLRVKRVDTLPDKFWREPMGYWPTRMPEGGQCFGRESDNETGDGLFGNDHEVFHVLYDKAASRAYISYYASL